jgi:hypothetical protein
MALARGKIFLGIDFDRYKNINLPICPPKKSKLR